MLVALTTQRCHRRGSSHSLFMAFDLVLKQFTARDVVSRCGVVELRSRASARTAVGALDAITARMPFAVPHDQRRWRWRVHGRLRESVPRVGTALFVLPPRSPKLHGAVERANRTHTEESYEITGAEPTVAALGVELRAWKHTYNFIRPRQALGYLTPG